MTHYPNPPLKIARYYPKEQRLTYYVGNHAQATRIKLSEAQAVSLIRAIADGPTETVQRLEIITTG